MPTIHLAIPVQDEVEHLPSCIEALRRQDGVRPVAWFCVNQPEAWRDDPDRQRVCQANRICLDLLRAATDLDVRIIDRSSPGLGWAPKREGVGRARRELMDAISEHADGEDLIVSLDADTLVPPGYLWSLLEVFEAHPTASAVAGRYCHPLVEDDGVSRAMLGYEIYMRFYVLNLWRIGSPYAFTALGSAIALPVRAYRRAGGITPRATGEDFYFVQKLVKLGRVLHWSEPVAPATRTSVRVPVGTGQAILAACRGEHADRYPLYAAELFDRVGRTTRAFPDLFAGAVPTPLDDFLREQAGTDEPWQPLRENHPSRERFVRACHERLDGLRILQYLKAEYRRSPTDDTETLRHWLRHHGSGLPETGSEARLWAGELRGRRLRDLETAELDGIREMLRRMEDHYRHRDYLRA